MLLFALSCQLPGLPAPAGTDATTTPAPAAPIPGAVSPSAAMDRLSRHAASLYFAGMGSETDLVKWEIQEIREAIEELEGQKVGDVDLAAASTAALSGPLTELETAATAETFANSYASLVSACNACHTQTGVAFIAIATPRVPPWSNVRYAWVGSRPGAGGPPTGMGPDGQRVPSAEGGDAPGQGTRRPLRPGMGPNGPRRGKTSQGE